MENLCYYFLPEINEQDTALNVPKEIMTKDCQTP